VFDMSAAPTCCSDPSRPHWIAPSEHVCQWATPVLLAIPNITMSRGADAGRRSQVLLAISEGRLGANFSSAGCATGSARGLWQRPSTDNGMSWSHHSVVANYTAPQLDGATSPRGGTSGIVLGSAVWDPGSQRAHLFYTTGCTSSPAECASATPRALHVRSGVLQPWPGSDSDTPMPAWGKPTDLTERLAAQGLHLRRFGPGTGVSLGSRGQSGGELLVCGVSVADSMACVVATASTSGAVTVRAAGQLSHPGGVRAVSMAVLPNGSLAFSLRVFGGLLFARSDDGGVSIRASPHEGVRPLPPSSCNGALAVLPSGLPSS
jgi:hypothetical protein